MLRDLTLKSVYDSSEHNLASDLFVPLLKEAIEYRRGVGFFTSGWLREAAEGLIPFAERGGRAYFVTSPHLEKKDWEALQLADRAKRDAAVYDFVHRGVGALEFTLREDTAAALAWLVVDGVLTFKFAIPKNQVGDYHDKVGIVTDMTGEKVVFHGSLNDSPHGLLNGESFSIFRSWEPGQQEYVHDHAERFERLWNDENDFFWVYDMTEAIREGLARLRRHHPRPYSLPQRSVQGSGIRVPPEVRLYPFQQEGVNNWLAAGGRGMFEMATGTGKTFTSLAAAATLHRQLGNLAVIVSAPFNHLVDQWMGEAKQFGFIPIPCRDSSRDWVPLVRSRIPDFNIGGRRSLFLVTTHKTGSERTFTHLIRNLQGHVLYIGDEVHYLGSPRYRRGLLETYRYRIGLSATPDRWFDPGGTAHLRGYFGSTVVDMPLEKAIGRFLTPYRYHPHLVSLTPEEMGDFNELSLKIVQQMASARRRNRNQRQENSLLEHYLRQRAALVAGASNKLLVLRRLLEARIREAGHENIRHAIVYCAPGQTRTVVRLLADLGLRAHEFVYNVPNVDRTRILEQFDAGDLQVLVAIKCLDEGVNIPATREVYFVSSTSNPREFVQRRGRVLRKHPGKERAILHDLVVVPPRRSFATETEEMDKVLLRKEMPRVAEFCSVADNEFEARDVLFPLLLRLDLVHLLDLKPWDIYHQATQWGDYSDTESA